ncbi:MAG: hypothetical protein H0T62_11995 [Parachlamydiaceae bacterium]|nr:hypothetical protein [Parachlamydiaceae bacterium]
MNWTLKFSFALCVVLSTTSAIFYSPKPIDSSTSGLIDLSRFEKRVYSQNGEDGIIKKIFELVGFNTGYFVEFGVQDGKECNTRYIREAYGCAGLIMDGGYEDASINLQKEFITAENINDLFAKYDVPNEFDLLSIDLDFNDFHVWKAISNHYKPRVIVMEFNSSHQPSEDKVVPYDPNGCWDHSNYFGASLLAMYNLGRAKGFSLVYVENAGVNCFFIRDDILEGMSSKFLNVNDVEALYKKPKYGWGPNGGHPADPYDRPYLDSAGLLDNN